MIFNNMLWTNKKGTKSVSISGAFIEKLMVINPSRCSSNGKAGGIVVGKYNERLDLCTVTDVVDPSPDSVIDGEGIYIRGHDGINELLKVLWNEPEQTYYVGEWFWVWGDKEATLREATEKTLKEISQSDNYDTKEPILFVLSGVIANRDIRAFIVEDGELVELKRADTPVELSVMKIIGGYHAITLEDGLKVCLALYTEATLFTRVRLSFEGIETIAAPFCNAAFGRLILLGMPRRYFRENIMLIEETRLKHWMIIKRVLENSEECRLDPEKLGAIEEVINEGACC